MTYRLNTSQIDPERLGYRQLASDDIKENIRRCVVNLKAVQSVDTTSLAGPQATSMTRTTARRLHHEGKD
jgi:hypothetical protein